MYERRRNHISPKTTIHLEAIPSTKKLFRDNHRLLPYASMRQQSPPSPSTLCVDSRLRNRPHHLLPDASTVPSLIPHTNFLPDASRVPLTILDQPAPDSGVLSFRRDPTVGGGLTLIQVAAATCTNAGVTSLRPKNLLETIIAFYPKRLCVDTPSPSTLCVDSPRRNLPCASTVPSAISLSYPMRRESP